MQSTDTNFCKLQFRFHCTHTHTGTSKFAHTSIYILSILFNEADNRYWQRIIVYFALCWQPCVVKCMRNNCKHTSF